jgi:hypothetical protein
MDGRATTADTPGDLPCGGVLMETGMGHLLANGRHASKPLQPGEAVLVWYGSMSGPGRYAMVVTTEGRLYKADPWDLVPAKTAAKATRACWIPQPVGRDRLWASLAPDEFKAYDRARGKHNDCVDRVFAPIRTKVKKMGKEIVVKDGRLWVYRDDYLQGLVDQGHKKYQRACKQDAATSRKATIALLTKWEKHVEGELARIR